ncbi:HNH endonuclease [Pseudonocardia sp. NPDC049635]|uniref:HNH endonuclease n=1 Tax=Pseudonocardia sp. NPDC049635 TaxID=3155506 RepID=UPI0033D23D00
MSEQPQTESRSRTPWGYEEIVLACDLVVANNWHALDRRTDDRVAELSSVLRQMSPMRAAQDPTFRNVQGVGRKTHDIATLHPEYSGQPTKGGKLTAAVVAAFLTEPGRMGDLATAIRAAGSLSPDEAPPPDLDDEATFAEGRPFERRHLARERDPEARRRKIIQVHNNNGVVRCEVCRFDFETVYGDRGRDFIECHHRDPLSVSGPRQTALGDLVLLCSNCHRMIHRYRPWLTVEQLMELVTARS